MKSPPFPLPPNAAEKKAHKKEEWEDVWRKRRSGGISGGGAVSS